MENTYRKQETTMGWGLFVLAAIVAPGIAALIAYFTGVYSGINVTRPTFMMPDVAFYVLSIIALVIFGISVYFTVKQIAESDSAKVLKVVAITLWLVSYTLSLIWLPIAFNLRSAIGSFLLIALIVAATTTQFLINLRISLPAALMILPYWAFMIYCGYINLMILL